MIDFRAEPDPDALGKWRVIGKNEMTGIVEFELGELDPVYAKEYAAELQDAQET